jgi:DNA-binding NarL/FixJ family response regulator
MASILQIAYYQGLLEVRKATLESCGHEVVNAFGNDEGMSLALSRPFDLVLVGFSTNYSVRAAVIQWLKQRLPQTPVVALRLHEGERFPEADYVDGRRCGLPESPLIARQPSAVFWVLANG